MNPLLEAQEKLFDEKFRSPIYVHFTSLEGYKKQGNVDQSFRIKSFLRQSNKAVIAEVVRIVEGMKSDSYEHLSPEMQRLCAHGNELLDDLRASLLEEMK